MIMRLNWAFSTKPSNSNMAQRTWRRKHRHYSLHSKILNQTAIFHAFFSTKAQTVCLLFLSFLLAPLILTHWKKKWQRMVGVVLVEQHIEQQQQSRVNKGVRNGSNFDYRQVSNQSTYISHKKRHELWPGSWALILCFGTRGDSKRPHRETGDVYSDSFCVLTGLGTNAFCCSKIPLKK